MENKRALAHIERINKIRPIIGADNIDYATVLGWNLIVKKDEFKVGDLCVYFEIDSLLPKRPWSEFMESKKYKVKTMKLGKFEGGIYSQGLALPLDLFVDEKYYNKLLNAKEGDDVTDIIGVKYYVAQDNIRKSNNIKTPFEVKFNRAMARHPKLAKNKIVRKLIKKPFGKRFLYLFIGSDKKDSDRKFPNKFDFINKTDETRCLIANTKVITDKGVYRISDIVNKKLDVKVKSFNQKTNEFEYKNILNYQKFNAEHLIKFIFLKTEIDRGIKSLTATNHNTLTCSYDHKLLTNNGYKTAFEINPKTDKLMMINKSYSDKAMELLYGLIIGDGHLYLDKRSNSNARITFTQGEKQKDYLLEKLRLLGEDNPKITKGKSGYSDNFVYSAHSCADRNFTRLLREDKALVNGKLIKTKEFCSRLSPLSLAIWYMDDGSIRHNNNDSFSPTIEFSTYSETEDEVDNLIWVLNCFGIEATKYKNHKNGNFIGHTIKLNVKATQDFLKLVSGYIPYCMRYKTISEYKNVPYLLEDFSYNQTDVLIPVGIYKKTLEKAKPLYDIEVEDNHNFLTNAIVSHNCEAIGESLLQNKEEWVQTTKLDGTSSTYILERKSHGKFEYYVCSRNVRQQDETQQTYHNSFDYGESNVYWDMEFKYHIRECLEDLLNKHTDWKYVCIQGETVGLGIQGNPHKLKDTQLFAFNFIDSVNGRWNSVEAKNLLAQYGIQFVPIINEHYVLPNDMETLKLQADGNLSEDLEGTSGLREGFVYRSLDGQRSFKNVSRKYLAKLKD